MKHSIAILFAFGFSLLTGCAAKDPGGIEAALVQQQGKMQESVRRNKARSEKRSQWWSDYKARNDAKYDRWVEGIMD